LATYNKVYSGKRVEKQQKCELKKKKGRFLLLLRQQKQEGVEIGTERRVERHTPLHGGGAGKLSWTEIQKV